MKGRNSIRVLAGTLAMLLSSGTFMVPGNMVVAAETVAVEEVPVPEEAVEVTEAVEVPEVVEAAEIEAAEPAAVVEAVELEAVEPVEVIEAVDVVETAFPALVEEIPDVETAEIPVDAEDEEVFELEGEEITESIDLMNSTHNSLENAQVISLNTSYSDSVTNTSYKNWYKFTLPADGYISVTQVHSYIESTSGYWYYYLYADTEKSNALRDWTIRGVDENTTSRKTGLPKGTYYICIDPGYYSKDVQYTLKVNYTKSSVWETERNDSFQTADTIALNTTYNGSSRSSGDEDYYKFTIKKDGVVTIQFKHPYIDSTSTYWKMYLYNDNDKNTQYLYRNYTGKDDSWVKTGGIGLKAGTYYVKIETYNNNAESYQLYVGYEASDYWEKEFNDTPPVATPIKAGVTYRGMSKSSNENDYYKFTLGSAGNVSFTFKHAYRNTSGSVWRLMLYNDKDKSNAKSTWYMKGNETSSKTGTIYLTPGTYYICVHSNWDSYATDVNYSLVLNTSYGNWQKSNGKWWYKYISGSYPRNKWEKIDGKWYHFDSSGYMQTGWKKIGGKYYYLGTDGIMRTGWTKVSGKWYYMDNNGIMQTGWKKIGGKWYYLGSDGVMRTGWTKIGSKWYYFDKNGVMQTGWLKQDGNWYYLNTDGTMVVNTKKTIGGKTYRFNKSGVCTNP